MKEHPDDFLYIGSGSGFMAICKGSEIDVVKTISKKLEVSNKDELVDYTDRVEATVRGAKNNYISRTKNITKLSRRYQFDADHILCLNGDLYTLELEFLDSVLNSMTDMDAKNRVVEKVKEMAKYMSEHIDDDDKQYKMLGYAIKGTINRTVNVIRWKKHLDMQRNKVEEWKPLLSREVVDSYDRITPGEPGIVVLLPGDEQGAYWFKEEADRDRTQIRKRRGRKAKHG